MNATREKRTLSWRQAEMILENRNLPSGYLDYDVDQFNTHTSKNKSKPIFKEILDIQGGEPEWGSLVPFYGRVGGEDPRVHKQEIKQKC